MSFQVTRAIWLVAPHIYNLYDPRPNGFHPQYDASRLHCWCSSYYINEHPQKQVDDSKPIIRITATLSKHLQVLLDHTEMVSVSGASKIPSNTRFYSLESLFENMQLRSEWLSTSARILYLRLWRKLSIPTITVSSKFTKASSVCNTIHLRAWKTPFLDFLNTLQNIPSLAFDSIQDMQFQSGWGHERCRYSYCLLNPFQGLTFWIQQVQFPRNFAWSVRDIVLFYFLRNHIFISDFFVLKLSSNKCWSFSTWVNLFTILSQEFHPLSLLVVPVRLLNKLN